MMCKLVEADELVDVLVEEFHVTTQEVNCKKQ